MTSKYKFTKENIVFDICKDKLFIGNLDTNELYEVKRIKKLKVKPFGNTKVVKIERVKLKIDD